MNPQWYKEMFEQMGIEYENYPFTKNTENEVKWLIHEVLTDTNMKIIDVGCGTGRHSIGLAKRGYKNITAIDLSPTMIQAAKEQAAKNNIDINFLVCDARQLPFENEFDAAICLCEGAFGLLENDVENYKILKAVHKSLKTNATFILTALNVFRDADFDPMTCRDSFTEEIQLKNGTKKLIKGSDRSFSFPELKWILQQLGFNILFGADPFSSEPIKKGSSKTRDSYLFFV